ncbi:MAG: glycosyltransferase [Thermoanaerobaculia bacterium]|nr:glycosyltransferase [Thermoanaerobaculia bacterium]
MSSTSTVTAPSEPRRVLVVTHSLTTGGAERFAATLASHLDPREFRSEIFVASNGLGYPVAPDVDVTTHGYRGLQNLPRVAWSLRKRLRTAPAVDVVVSNVLSTSCLVAAARGRRGVPWIARIGLAPEVGDRWPQSWLAAWAYPWATALVSNSKEMATAVEQRYLGTSGRVRSIPNPTDFRSLDLLAQGELPSGARREADEMVLLVVGRLSEQKRVDVALRVLSQLQRRRPVRLWVLGRGPLEPELRRLATELGVSEVVDWLGFCDNPFPLMRHADLFLLTSDFEGLPNALIEAQGLGLPAVATRCPYGPSEIIDDGVTGSLAAIGEVEGLVEAVEGWLISPRRRAAAGSAAAERARSLFDLAVVMPQWEKLLAEASSSAERAGGS